MSYAKHLEDSKSIAARCAVITLSDTRTDAADASGSRIQESLERDGHTVAIRRLIPDEPGVLHELLTELFSRHDLDVIFTNGGTGISRRDATIEVVERHLDQALPGFGELFRMLSWEQIGSGAMLSRALGGVARGKLLFAMPGSTAAVELAMSRLILPELRHLVSELKK